MPNVAYLSKLTVPVNVSGEISNVEYTIKDAEAREMITDLGNALYWLGVTTTVMSDGLTTADVVINGETKTPSVGAIVSYESEEFVWNGSSWQAFGSANYGALAYKSSASATYTPAGTISVSEAADTTASVTPFGSAGTLPEAYFTVSGETATFNWSAGTLPSAGTAVSVVTASGARTATFSGTQATITVE